MYSNRKIGGIRFIRVGRLSFSFCVTKRREPPMSDGEYASLALIALTFIAAVFSA